MREIKFRAYLTDKKMMFYDYIVSVNFADNAPIKIMQFTGLKDKNGKEIYESDIVKYHWFRSNGDWISRSNGDWIGGSWIVRFGEANTMDIEFGDIFLGFFLEIFRILPTTSYKLEEHRTILGINDLLEVIGNIYENPELLNRVEIALY